VLAAKIVKERGVPSRETRVSNLDERGANWGEEGDALQDWYREIELEARIRGSSESVRRSELPGEGPNKKRRI